MKRGLHQSKVTFSLAAIQRPGLLAHKRKNGLFFSNSFFDFYSWEIVSLNDIKQGETYKVM